ncbi:MAG: acetyl-CoA carboxylase biotin carboxylase subunit, partial [Peptococcaceae bacterium]|nr:acetyl-CoA carboxylase biotin carboxylase subunit [Peptococcaceae bacterium]
ALSEETRKKLHETALRAARAVKYQNAGTLEFLVTADGDFYFMEMNTRLQVEHTITEMVTGIDLVKWQIRIAAGIPLSITQEEACAEGCAIECRINAEDSTNDFRPCAGKITTLHVPGGPWVRFDTAVYQDYTIPPFYDSMIGKLIVYARTREEAIRKMRAALCELIVDGVSINSDLQLSILEDSRFIAGDYYTNFMEQFQLTI